MFFRSTFLILFLTLTCPLAIAQCTFYLLVNTTDETACGSCNGLAGVMPSAGNPPYTFLWNDPDSQTTQLATGLCSGTYSVIVTDTAGCTDSATTTVYCPGCMISLNTNSTDENGCNACNGTVSAGVSGGAPPYSYFWGTSPIQTTATASGLCPGTYQVSVTDSAGCSETASAIVTSYVSSLMLTGSSTNAICGDSTGTATITVSGGVTPFTYFWNVAAGWQTNSTATGLPAGTFWVTVTDSTGCSDTSQVSVNNTEGPAATVQSSSNVSCNGGNDGTATAMASGGAPPYTYLWNDSINQTTSVATGLAPGIYFVIISDTSGCSAAAAAAISEPQQLIAAITSVTHTACSDSCDGLAVISVSGGVPPYSCFWSTSPPQTGSTATGLCAGNYPVILTDSNGCTSSAAVTVTSPLPIVLSSTTVDAGCNKNDGSAAVTVTGGSNPYTYLWSNGSGSPVANNLWAGVYSCTVTDVMGCSDTIHVNIGSENFPAVTLSASNLKCYGDKNGLIAASVNNGTPPYGYQWNDLQSQTTQIASGLEAGVYAVTVTDTAGCSVVSAAVVAQPTVLSVNFITKPEVCRDGNNGAAKALPAGGTPPYAYAWYPPLTQTTDSVTGLHNGTYFLMLMDTNNCMVTDTVFIAATGEFTDSLAVTNELCDNTKDGSIQIIISGGQEPFTYSWNKTSLPSSGVVTGLDTGTYFVIITDSNHCSVKDSALITFGIEGCFDIPNTFTPNGDGINDAWRIRGIEAYPDVLVEIYNRWGSLLYLSDGYIAPWDGKYNGREVPAAAYYYIIQLGNGETLTGTVAVVR